MLQSRKVLDFPRIGAWLGTASVLHPRFRIFVNAQRGATFDLFPLFGGAPVSWRTGDRAVLTVSLGGENRIRTKKHESLLLPGEFAAGHIFQGCFLRYSTATSLVIEWEPGYLGGGLGDGSTGRLSLDTLRRLRDFAGALVSEELPDPRLQSMVGEMLAMLRAEGFPIDARDGKEIWSEPSPWARRLSLAMDEALSGVQNGPTFGELERSLGWTRQYIQRRLRSFHAHYGFNVSGGWRERLHRWRLLVGATLCTSARATTEEVAIALGYSGPVALCNAFAAAGLPSPSALREMVLARA